MNLVGWYFEEREDGRGLQLVLVQPADDPGENVEHVARTPDELWAAFVAIANDPDLPDAETQIINGSPERAAGDDLSSVAMDAAEGFITEALGPSFGRLAGGAMRNPDRVLQFLRGISRKDRR